MILLVMIQRIVLYQDEKRGHYLFIYFSIEENSV